MQPDGLGSNHDSIIRLINWTHIWKWDTYRRIVMLWLTSCNMETLPNHGQCLSECSMIVCFCGHRNPVIRIRAGRQKVSEIIGLNRNNTSLGIRAHTHLSMWVRGNSSKLLQNHLNAKGLTKPNQNSEKRKKKKETTWLTSKSHDEMRTRNSGQHVFSSWWLTVWSSTKWL